MKKAGSRLKTYKNRLKSATIYHNLVELLTHNNYKSVALPIELLRRVVIEYHISYKIASVLTHFATFFTKNISNLVKISYKLNFAQLLKSNRTHCIPKNKLFYSQGCIDRS